MFCINCGTKMTDGDQFCGVCGAKAYVPEVSTQKQSKVVYVNEKPPKELVDYRIVLPCVFLIVFMSLLSIVLISLYTKDVHNIFKNDYKSIVVIE